MSARQLPDPSLVAELARLARTELSLRARLGYVLLALTAAVMTVVVVSLWWTEPALPPRTIAAFALLTIVGVSWVAYAAWVLSAKRVMLARQRVVAGRLAVAWTGAFAAGCLALAMTTGPDAAWSAFAMGLVLLAVAVVLWRRAVAARARLVARRDALEGALRERAR